MSEMQERVALVTGASRGLGRAVALGLAKAGWRIVCVARSRKALEELDDEVKGAGLHEATLVPLDLKDGEAIDGLGAALYERFGKLDALVACAGVLGPLTPSFQATPGVMAEVMNVNFHANQRLIRSMHPLLRAAPAARAVFVTCEAARNTQAYWGPYAASKAALDALVHAYALEVAITPIRVSLFEPPAMRTALRAKGFPGEDVAKLAEPESVAVELIAHLTAGEVANGARVSAGG